MTMQAVTSYEENDWNAGLDGATEGRLLVRRGISEWRIRTLAESSEGYRDGAGGFLYRARFSGTPPKLEAHDGRIEVVYARRFFGFHDSRADFELSGAVPWEIAIDGGVSDVQAMLRELSIRSIDVRGGVSKAEIELPAPRDRVPIRIRGGVDQLSIVRPANTALRLRVHGGATEIALDEQRFGAVGGQLVLDSRGFDAASGSYDLEIDGGANRVTISER